MSVDDLDEESSRFETIPTLDIEEAHAQGRVVLVAEDNEINQKVIKIQLALLGYACEIARNGEEALAMWRDGDYAMIITDLHMPVMDGFALTTAVRREEPQGQRIPIIAFTADISIEQKRRFSIAGVDGFLTKPATTESLSGVMRNWLDLAEPVAGALSVVGERAKCEPNGAAVFDVHLLEGLIGSDPALVSEFLRDYIDLIRKGRDDLRDALNRCDREAVHAIAHRLRSASRSVGATLLGDYMQELEAAGQSNDQEEIAKLMPQVEHGVAEVLSAIYNSSSHPVHEQAG